MVGKHNRDISIEVIVWEQHVVEFEGTSTLTEVPTHRNTKSKTMEPPNPPIETTTKSIIVWDTERQWEEVFKGIIEPKFSIPKI